MVIDDEQLHKRRCACAIDHDSNLRTIIINIPQDLLQQHIRYLIRCLHGFPVGSRLPVDADSHFHLIIRQFKSRLSRCGNRTRLGGSAHGPHIINDLLGNGLHLVQGSPFLCQGARDFMYENGSGHASAPHGIKTVLDRHIIVGHHMLNRDSLHLGHLSSHLKVHHVAGIVLHNHQHACVRCNRLDALINLVRGRGGKHGSCNCRIQHPGSHEPAVRRLVSAAAAADQGNLALLLMRAHHDVAAVQLPQILRISLDHALNHLFLYQRYIVDKFLHIANPLILL